MNALIVDDHALFGEGLKLLLMAAMPALKAQCCTSGTQALALAAGTAFDLVLLDWNLGTEPGGAELVQALKTAAPMARVVVISGEGGAAVVRLAIEAGAVGFVPKESSPALLVDALSVTAHGGVYLPAAVLGAPLAAVPASAPPGEPPPAPASGPAAAGPLAPSAPHMQILAEAFPQLTPRRLQVLDHVARGMSNKQIARMLDIDDDTVKQHLNKVYAQLGVATRTEAVYLMARRGVRFG